MKASLHFLCACALLVFLLATAIPAHNLVSALLEKWSEVATFTGTGSREYQNTTYFVVNYSEWRIYWEYTTNSDYTRAAGFFVYVYKQGQADYIGLISDVGGYNTNGTSYVENLTGTFYMSILAGSPAVTGYTLVVEQNLDSVPEFPSSSLLPLTFTVALLFTGALVFSRRRQRSARV